MVTQLSGHQRLLLRITLAQEYRIAYHIMALYNFSNEDIADIFFLVKYCY